MRLHPNPIRPFLLRAATWTAVVLALGSVASPSRAEEGVRLRYGFRPGSSYSIRVGLNLAMQTELQGLPPEAAALAEMAKDVREEMALALLLDAGAPGEDGSTPLTVRIEDVQSKLAAGGQVVQMQGLEERLEGATILEGKLSRDGRSIVLAPPSASGIPDASREMVSLLLQSLPALPEREMHPGDSFEIPARFEMPGFGSGEGMETKGNLHFTLRSIEGGKAQFDVRGDASATATGDPARPMTMKASSLGTTEFDLEEGVFSASRAELGMELDLEMQLPSSSPPPAAPVTLKVHGNAKGPVEIAVTRVVATTN
jgi:hypothetical protein